jgi:hypothetical protein
MAVKSMMVFKSLRWFLLLLPFLACVPSLHAERADSNTLLRVRVAAFAGQFKGREVPDEAVRLFELPDTKIMETFDVLATRYYQRQIHLPAMLELSSVNLMCVYTISIQPRDLSHKKKFKYRGGIAPFVDLELTARAYANEKLNLEVGAKYGKYAIRRELVTAALGRTSVLRKKVGTLGFLFIAIAPVEDRHPSTENLQYPRVVKSPHPPYPPDMKSLRISGKVVMKIIVEASGKIKPDFAVVVETPYPSFSRSAFTTIHDAWVFKPALRDGKPVATYANVEVTFALR